MNISKYNLVEVANMNGFLHGSKCRIIPSLPSTLLNEHELGDFEYIPSVINHFRELFDLFRISHSNIHKTLSEAMDAAVTQGLNRHCVYYLLECPLSELLLLVNSKHGWVREVVKYRLKIKK